MEKYTFTFPFRGYKKTSFFVASANFLIENIIKNADFLSKNRKKASVFVYNLIILEISSV